MRQISEISSDPKQKFTFITDDNISFEFKLEFIASQQGWFYSLKYQNLSINGNRLVTDINILRSYKNILPFGIGIMTDDATEPFLIDDFSTGRVKFYLLDKAEVKDLETTFYNNL
jgi:hypothetical protein